ncbi:hypothetical protein UFOVP965_79 [uncultured Caudovirales phage]|uniref:Uncharacterized protein n=1 Tax=uncultured Caudovirales phage TaxID=2100421 RepID=A0A6J5Q6B2_9CAUD|nr:hypothetical protein UFOVP965_79 [uncultured Caudovirales phage]CAB4179839.1 hypothetical protein UFOVP1035_75 [uncultured Caudovirales phage]CAB4188552.1 hypothetical protein UFOVP1181_34 [uncultured Caudovirales phage]
MNHNGSQFPISHVKVIKADAPITGKLNPRIVTNDLKNSDTKTGHVFDKPAGAFRHGIPVASGVAKTHKDAYNAASNDFLKDKGDFWKVRD